MELRLSRASRSQTGMPLLPSCSIGGRGEEESRRGGVGEGGGEGEREGRAEEGSRRREGGEKRRGEGGGGRGKGE